MGLDGIIYKTQDEPKKQTNSRNPWWEQVPWEEVDYDQCYLERDWQEHEDGTWWREKSDEDKNRSISVAEFRHNWTLQYWMRKLWRRKGGKPSPGHDPDEFNYPDCVELNTKDLDRLIRHVRTGKMPFAHGRPHRHDRHAQAAMIVAARQAKEALKEGDFVYYIPSY